MGYGTRDHGIRTFWPDDTATELWLTASDSLPRSMASILEACHEKWPDSKDHPERLLLSSEYIHTDCLSYDLYDPGDWAHFIRIEYTPG